MTGRVNLKILLIISAFFAAIPQTSFARHIIYVDGAAIGDNNGSSWEDAYKYLQNALVVAEQNTDIWVAQGIYRPDDDTNHPEGTNDRTATFQLKNGVALYGGFPTGGSSWENRDPNTYITILSGDINFPNNNTDNSYHVVTGSGTNSTAILDSFTITAGYAYGPTSYKYGAGMYNSSGSPTVTNCTFSGNSAYDYGGGIYNNQSSPTIKNCTFTSNYSSSRGGGIHNENHSNPTIETCSFTGNSAGVNGGGISNYDNSSPIVERCAFTSNSVNNNYGGGIYNDSYCNPVVRDCDFNNNSAAYDGGGIYNYFYSNPAIESCTFNVNSAGINGGGMCNYRYCNPTISACTFNGNSVGSFGGGIYNGYSNPTVKSCAFIGNTCNYQGGGMHNYESRPVLKGCTFTGNSAPATQYGGAIANAYSYPSLTNCIVWDNPPSEIAGTTSFITYSDIKGGWTGTGNININPRFVQPAAGDYHLRPDSPCINTGDPSFNPEPNETDFDGEPRIMLNRVDMGADEFNPFEIDFTIVNKRRIGRTLFEYDCEVTLTNVSRFAVYNVALEITKASDNMVVIDPAVTFGVLEIGPGESATSLDMCTFQIDRSQATDPAKIIWKSVCELVGGASGVQDIASGTYFLNLAIFASDFNHDNKVDLFDLNILTDQWLLPPGSPSADIAPFPTGDNFVNFLDFALLAQNWLEGTDE